MRIILYTGKGGVGKTSIAAASALRIAAGGKNVLIMSTDQAHSLGDSLDRKLGNEPVHITENMDALEIDTEYESEKSWGRMREYIKRLLTFRGEDGIEVEELLVFPGLEELFSLFRILEFFEKGEYECLIVDCAPTGETLSLLKYPEKLSDFMARLLPVKRKAARAAGPLVEKISKIPMPEDTVFDDLEFIMDKMGRLQRLLLDKKTVSLRIVTTPEKIVIQEAKRNFTCLHLYNYNVDAVIINRIYPEEAMEGYFHQWIKRQKENLKEIEESFSFVPKFYLELQKEEVRTLPVLQRVGKLLFGERDVSQIFFCEEIYTVKEEGKDTVLHIWIPFANKEEMELSRQDGELILGIKNETRRFPMPVQAKEKELAGARFEEGYLKIYFQ